MATKKRHTIVTISLLIATILSTTIFYSPQNPTYAQVAPYHLIFTESGLSPSVSWSVTVNGLVFSSTTNEITIDCQSASTYSYSVNPPPGYISEKPLTGFVTIAASDASVTIVFVPTHTVSFVQTSLIVGMPWTVTLNGTTKTSTASIITFESYPNGEYSYSILPPENYISNPAGTITVNGADYVQTVYFERTYNVYFTASGLSKDTPWTVNLNGVLVASQSVTNFFKGLLPGVYSYSIIVPAGYKIAGSSTGQVTVVASDSFIPVVFLPTYAINFIQTGLEPNTPWSVIMDGTVRTSTTSKIAFNGFTPGDYPFEVLLPNNYVSHASLNGTATITDVDATITIPFEPTHTVTFTAKGLAHDTFWAVALNGTLQSAQNSAIQFKGCIAADYCYNISVPNGYVLNCSTGNLSVSNRDLEQFVTFQPLYKVEFKLQNALPDGLSWNVTLNEVTQKTAGTLIAFDVLDGTYAYQIELPPGYTATAQLSGNITVTGSSEAILIVQVVVLESSSPTPAPTSVPESNPSPTNSPHTLKPTASPQNTTPPSNTPTAYPTTYPKKVDNLLNAIIMLIIATVAALIITLVLIRKRASKKWMNNYGSLY